MAYAHSRNDRGERHDLADHLRGVATLAAEFAEPLGATGLANRVGLWLDTVNFSPSLNLSRGGFGESCRRIQLWWECSPKALSTPTARSPATPDRPCEETSDAERR
jgi:hypothetical protein